MAADAITATDVSLISRVILALVAAFITVITTFTNTHDWWTVLIPRHRHMHGPAEIVGVRPQVWPVFPQYPRERRNDLAVAKRWGGGELLISVTDAAAAPTPTAGASSAAVVHAILLCARAARGALEGVCERSLHCSRAVLARIVSLPQHLVVRVAWRL
jgi:hypothetical protein